jgi:hypothetical protein
MSTCPHHPAVPLSAPDNALGASICGECGGHFLSGESAHRFVKEDVGLEPSMIPTLASEGTPSGLRCSGCGHELLRMRLKGVEVDWCSQCGGLWLDASEAERLSRGAYVEPGAASAMTSFDAPGRPVPPARQLVESFLGTVKTIQIHGQFRWLEVLFGAEMANRYNVLTDAGAGYALETTDGLLGLLKRLLLRSHRTLDVEVFDPREQLTLTLSRPFYWLFSDMTVRDADNRKLGSVRRRFHLLNKRYDLHGPEGRIFARVNAPFWRIWKFPIVDDRGDQVALVRKRWKGLMREMYTDADKFTVELGERSWSVEQRAVLFAACLSIDLDFFENNNRH